MEKTFFDKSKRIANDFLQSIVFIDDNAYIDKAGNPHDFDALEITKYFSFSGKFCSIFRPTKEDDLNSIINVSKKADVVVIDWEINLTQEFNDNNSDNESIADTDIRGLHTKKIIKHLLSDANSGKNSLKLLIIYTGTTDLPGITEEIKTYLEADEFVNLISERVNNNCCLYSKNIRIQTIYKGGDAADLESDKFKHIPDLKSQVVTVEQLPDFILSEFTKLTSGLLSNFALQVLTEIRRNSHRIISLFPKELDAAYLAHQAILPNVDDANELLVELFKDIFNDLLKQNQLHKFLGLKLIKLWLDEHIKEERLFLFDKKGNTTSLVFTRRVDLLNKLIFSKNNDVTKRFKEEFNKIDSFRSLCKEQKEDCLNSTIKNCLYLFKSNDSLDLDSINKKFAVLTHHRNFITPLIGSPLLSLGTVIESTSGVYLVCIQQRCDSIRIKKDRRFLFLTLQIVNNTEPFDYVTPNGIKLKINKKTYDIRTVKFSDASGSINAKKENTDYYFYPMHYKSDPDEKFKWVFELKDLHAQRIVANYCSELSRVGLDESEWLRLNQK